jgi:hypothetical protein
VDELFLRDILWTDDACFMHARVFNAHNSHLWALGIVTLSLNMGIKSVSASVFELELFKTLSWNPVYYLTGSMFSDTMIFWNLFC